MGEAMPSVDADSAAVAWQGQELSRKELQRLSMDKNRKGTAGNRDAMLRQSWAQPGSEPRRKSPVVLGMALDKHGTETVWSGNEMGRFARARPGIGSKALKWQGREP